MTQGFYEQLGVDPRTPATVIRSAYSRCVAQILRRRKAIVEQGGDPSPLDLARSQLDEAWKVLSDAPRRRRYDAMLALSRDGWTTDTNELWRRVAGALVHPAAGAAAELLRVGTNLKVGALPPVPKAGGRAAFAEEDVTSRTGTTKKLAPVEPAPGPVELADIGDPDAEETSDARIVPLPNRATTPPDSSLRVVHGAGSSVIVMPPPPSRKTLSAEDVARLIDRHSYTGALLRAVREAKGLTLQQLAETTRISIRYLEAIEGDERDRLPSPTFVRGYVREMARQLELDEQATVSGYMRNAAGGS